MSPDPFSSRFAQRLRQARANLRGGHLVALSAVAVVAFGLVGLRAVDLPGPSPVSADGRLQIEVVHPVEPDIVPGSTMDVGELVDGFQGVPPPLPPLTDVMWSYDDWEEGEDTAAPARTVDRRRAEASGYYVRPEPERSSPVRTVRRWFGFDAPRRDFQAERAARRARLEALERDARERHDRERRRYERAELDRYAREAPRWQEDRGLDERRDEGRDRSLRDERGPDRDGGPVPYDAHDVREAPMAELEG